MEHSFSFKAIGYIDSVFEEKFGAPRQSGLIPSAQGCLQLLPDYHQAGVFEGLETISHIWIQWVFHEHLDAGWQPKVRPPRLGGNAKKGVFATRSPFRPNPIGLSVVRIERIDAQKGCIWVSGGDFISGTPILDIKPYVPYVDALSEAHCDFAQNAPAPSLNVVFDPHLIETLFNQGEKENQLKALIEATLQYDPRPAYKKEADDSKIYKMRLAGFDIHWRVEQNTFAYVEYCIPHL